MKDLLGLLGVLALVGGGALSYAPKAPEEPRPVVVAEAPPPPPAAEAAKAPGEGAPSGG
jgi:hypothetical protein